MHLHSLNQLHTLVRQFADFAEDPFRTWGDAVGITGDTTLWEVEICGIVWTLEGEPSDYLSAFSLRPSTFPLDDYMTINVTSDAEGSLKELIIAFVIKSNRPSVPSRVHYVQVDFVTEQVNLYTHEGTTKIRKDIVGNDSFRQDNILDSEDRLVRLITNRLPVGMFEVDLVTAG